MTFWLIVVLAFAAFIGWIRWTRRRDLRGVRGHDENGNKDLGAYGGPPVYQTRDQQGGQFGP